MSSKPIVHPRNYFPVAILASFLFTLISSAVCAQDEVNSSKGISVPKRHGPLIPGQTYAVVVGIDRYQSAKIPKLKYASSDAIAFRNFLCSEAGGKVPPDHVRTFINDSATTGNFKIRGLRWVASKAKTGDRVYFYFSGHGITVSGGDSYFLAYNLAEDFYVENIEEAGTQAFYQLKTNTIRPLSEKGVEVILIVDACRSDLADSLRSETVKNFSPDVSSAEINAGDIVFLSSSNGQPSIETSKDNIRHGVFTFFFLKGAYGFADNGRNPDGVITFNKLKSFVERNVADYTGDLQIPRIDYKGRGNPAISLVDSLSIAIARQTEAQGNSFISVFEGKTINKGLTRVIDQFPDLAKAIDSGRVWGLNGAVAAFRSLEQSPLDSVTLRTLAVEVIAVTVDSGQSVLNKYLAAERSVQLTSAGELSALFKRGAEYFQTAFDISVKYFGNDPETKVIRQRSLFMKGRELSYNPNALDSALYYLQSALRLDTSSIYVQHAVATVLMARGDYEQSLILFTNVLKKHPTWIFAWNNLGNLYKRMGHFSESRNAYLKSVQFDSLFIMGWVNLGILYRESNCFDEAIQAFRMALKIDFQNVSAIINLGLTYMAQSNWSDALETFGRLQWLNVENHVVEYYLRMATSLRDKYGSFNYKLQ